LVNFKSGLNLGIGSGIGLLDYLIVLDRLKSSRHLLRPGQVSKIEFNFPV